MLFNSYEFIFGYVPVTLAVFFWLGGMNVRLAAAWLTAASLFFYGWWNPAYVGLLLGSIGFNYVFGTWIARAVERGDAVAAKRYLVAALVGDLGLLGYYKYANFFLESVNAVAGTQWGAGEIVLPLGISFFTFTQIAFLVDAYQGKVREYNFVHYGLFVTYFPHLIAGPVLHHAEMMPQFAKAATYRFRSEEMAVGVTVFVIGLFKKVILADGIGRYVGPIFDAPAAGVELTLLEAWFGALAYALQLYFDFSGYSDMAVGLSKMIGVRLPLNFHSPYKAVNIIEFWRRWHMTLSRFLRDYLYVPLGGNRKGKARRYVNLLVTMLLGGLWHGAGWTFVIWGGLHGVYLMVNHAWRALRERLGQDLRRSTRLGAAAGCLLTFAAWVFSLAFFRAHSLDDALNVVAGMAGLNGFALPDTWLAKWGAAGAWLAGQGVAGVDRGLVTGGLVNWVLILLAIAWFAPNTQQILAAYRPALESPEPGAAPRWLSWRPNLAFALAAAVAALASIASLTQDSEFLYFQF